MHDAAHRPNEPVKISPFNQVPVAIDVPELIYGLLPRLLKRPVIRRLATRSGAFFLLALLLAFAVGTSYAQTSRANLSGTVEDATGAKIPKAQVVITNVDTRISRTITANDDGNYNAPALTPGNYIIKVSAPGFAGETRKGVVLTVGEASLINFALKVGSITQEVVVTESPASVDVTSSQLSNAVSGHEMRELPLNGRSWTDLASLSPGVTVIQTQPPVSAPDRMKRGLGGQLSIAGGRPQQNSYLLDGININDYSNAGPGSVLGGNIGVDALQEFTVVTTNPTAQYGRTAAGVISAVTRSGANAFHGSAYEFARNAALDARNYFDPVQKPDFSRNQFGASFGGPIQKEKTFIFGDYEGVRQNLGVSYIDTVPSPAARVGTLCVPSADGSNPCASTMQVTPDPAIVTFLNAFIPLPNTGTTQGDTGTYTFPAYQVTSENYFTIKVDRTFSQKDSAAVVYMYDNSPSQQPDAFNNVLTLSKTVRQAVSILETHILSSTTVNTFHAGFSRDNAGSPYAASAIKPAAADPQFGFQPGDSAGIVQVPGLTTFTGGVSAASPLLFRWNSFQGYDDVSHTAGKNNVTFGVSIERIQDNQESSDAPGGNFSFPSLDDFITNQPQSFITTLPSTLTPRNLRQTIFGAYVQDDLRLTPNLTLNLGLRYETASVPYEINGKLSNLRILQGDTPYLGNPYIKNPTFKNFQPKVGFAWDPFHDGNTSIRGAFGIYDVLPYIVEMGSGVDAAYPFAQDASTGVLPAGAFPTTAYQIVANNPANRNFYVLQYNPPRNYIMMWNLNVQRAIAKDTTLLVGYVGSRGVHNWYQTDDANIVLPTTPDGKSFYWPTPIGSGIVVDPLVGQTLDARWNGSSSFHGLETQITQSPWHGLQGQLSYTWSRCIDTSSGSAASDQYRNSLNVDLYIAPATHRGPCDTNVGQNLTINAIWNLPGDQSRHGIAGWAINGWQTGGIFSAASGAPFSVTIGGDPLGTNAAIPFDFPDRIKGCGKSLTTGDPNGFINLKCFAFPDPVNRMGNAGRNELTGPRSINFDFSLYKNTPIERFGKGANLQLRAEIFNLMNHADFAAPTDHFQIYDGSGNGVPSAGLIDQTTLTSRQIQLAVKLTF
ncbi:TonB-dependent receptor [Tunturibacter empetritectus]|uniref:Outer membrane receptor protein involved in Fe transport n=1 Tax=Tunturiibacter lichenicola TaxID=2051959 RepID=A0A7W8N4M2_9BACT|nr:carboxypeptidase regulatory-like domain-containing protein [Edaphobacter lichenicola]MBB5343711.1 outer membrane receptor protein involved in Fe transport [Edaphobacter lichenicola]